MDLHYKIRPDSDNVAKFQGDRSRELGERVAKKKKKKKTSLAFYKSSRTTVTGGLIIIQHLYSAMKSGDTEALDMRDMLQRERERDSDLVWIQASTSESTTVLKQTVEYIQSHICLFHRL